LIAQPLEEGGKPIIVKRCVLSLIIAFSMLCGCSAYSESTTNYTYDDLNTLEELIAEQTLNMEAAH
jgi:hypothetical protein